MNLVMFDIDGTLTQTFAVDADCFVQALEEVAGFTGISTNWGDYRHTTDSGILDEIYQSHLKRAPTHDEVSAMQDHFLRLLNRVASQMPHAFAPVPGANDFIKHLLEEGYAVALASGGWKDTARMKLRKAGLTLEKMPAAFADDALSREEIMLCSHRRACRSFGVTEFEEITYIGDGLWDARASQALNYRFVGIGLGDRASLLSLGAIGFLSDFTDSNAAWALLTASRTQK